MSRTRGTFQSLRDPSDLYMGRAPFGIDLLLFGRKNVVNLVFGQHRGVRCKIARISFEVPLIVELSWVYKNRNNDYIGRLSSFTDQRQMALMERAHRRNKRNGFILPPKLT